MARKVSKIPHGGNEIIINLDDRKEVDTIDRIGGHTVTQITVIRNGKRVVGWFSVGMLRGQLMMDIAVNTKQGEKHKHLRAIPWREIPSA